MLAQKKVSSNKVSLTSNGSWFQRQSSSHQRKGSCKEINMEDVVSLMSKRKWLEVHKVLPKLKGEMSRNANKKCSPGCVENHGLLHLACYFRPPLSIVQVISKNFGGVNQTDCMNRYPLHVALMHGSSVNVIHFLVKQNPEAVALPDTNGKTSLHLAFYGQEHSYFDLELEQSLINKVEILCAVAPSTVTMEDENGMNPIELAIEEEVDYEVVRKLQKVAFHLNREKYYPQHKTARTSQVDKYLHNLLFRKMHVLTKRQTTSQAA